MWTIFHKIRSVDNTAMEVFSMVTENDLLLETDYRKQRLITSFDVCRLSLIMWIGFSWKAVSVMNNVAKVINRKWKWEKHTQYLYSFMISFRSISFSSYLFFSLWGQENTESVINRLTAVWSMEYRVRWFFFHVIYMNYMIHCLNG